MNREAALAALYRVGRRAGEVDPPAPGPDNQVGIYRGLSFTQYHALPGVNHSTLERVRRSPAHAARGDPTPERADRGPRPRARLPRPPPRAGPLPARVRPSAPDVNRRTKIGRAAWARWERENAGRFLLKREELELYERMAEAVLAHPVAARSSVVAAPPSSPSSGATPETELLCKGRADRLGELAVLARSSST